MRTYPHDRIEWTSQKHRPTKQEPSSPWSSLIASTNARHVLDDGWDFCTLLTSKIPSLILPIARSRSPWHSWRTEVKSSSFQVAEKSSLSVESCLEKVLSPAETEVMTGVDAASLLSLGFCVFDAILLLVVWVLYVCATSRVGRVLRPKPRSLAFFSPSRPARDRAPPQMSSSRLFDVFDQEQADGPADGTLILSGATETVTETFGEVANKDKGVKRSSSPKKVASKKSRPSASSDGNQDGPTDDEVDSASRKKMRSLDAMPIVADSFETQAEKEFVAARIDAETGSQVTEEKKVVLAHQVHPSVTNDDM